ncbi:hypothetical protein EVAR_49294_1 [Eumeta japonica]|uniref:Uncharacterized protein n=1 Tax=Eumeta variegata TaxID=151549 RepID=A0A4C1XKR8_EUMVA|nr:hypothetical protein EVAR_49294_1 [Eumeta japonica]
MLRGEFDDGATECGNSDKRKQDWDREQQQNRDLDRDEIEDEEARSCKAAAAARKICEIEGEDSGNERTAQRRFNRLTLVDHSRSGFAPVWGTETTNEQ